MRSFNIGLSEGTYSAHHIPRQVHSDMMSHQAWLLNISAQMIRGCNGVEMGLGLRELKEKTKTKKTKPLFYLPLPLLYVPKQQTTQGLGEGRFASYSLDNT